MLLARVDGVSYYISFLKDRSELKDWIQLAKDSDRKLDRNPITIEALSKRYIQSFKSIDNIYKEIHYQIGLSIFEETEKFSNLDMYTFE